MYAFYLPHGLSEIELENFILFFGEYVRLSNRSDAIVFIESTQNAIFIKQNLSKKLYHKIISVMSEVKQKKVTPEDIERIKSKFSILPDAELNRIGWDRTEWQGSGKELAYRMICLYEGYFTGLEFIHFGLNRMIRSISGILVNSVCQFLNIDFYMVAATPLKGRVTVYHSVYRQMKGIEDKCLEYQNADLRSDIVDEVNNYISKYREFKKVAHQKIFVQRRINRTIFSKAFFRARVSEMPKKILMNMKYPRLLQRRIDKSKPYLLILLSKSNSWVANYALPEFSNDVSVLEKVINAIPLDYQIVIKDHPHMGPFNSSRQQLYSLISKSKNCCYLLDEQHSTLDLVYNAQAVFFIASTSGVEALLDFKRVVTVGAIPFWFDFKNPPVGLVHTLEEMKSDLFNQIMVPSDSICIYAYLKSILARSLTWNGNYNPLEINISAGRKNDWTTSANILFNETSQAMTSKHGYSTT